MFIAIDIGNTYTVVGIYKNDTIISVCRLKSTMKQKEDEIFAKVHSLLIKVGIDKNIIDGIGISSVVPDLTNIYTAMVKKYFHRKPMIVSIKLNLGIKIFYDDPKTLGADRICSAIAGYSKYGGPLIIIDFGTATTYNVITQNGDFLGGVIAPGIETSAISLHKRTAKLPQIITPKLHHPETVINTNTISSIQAGIVFGALDSMTGIVNRVQKELQKQRLKKAIVIATGGFSTFVSEQTNIIQYIEPNLVLDGIRLIHDRVKSK